MGKEGRRHQIMMTLILSKSKLICFSGPFDYDFVRVMTKVEESRIIIKSSTCASM